MTDYLFAVDFVAECVAPVGDFLIYQHVFPELMYHTVVERVVENLLS